MYATDGCTAKVRKIFSVQLFLTNFNKQTPMSVVTHIGV